MKRIAGYIGNYEEALLIVHASRLGCIEPTRGRLNNDEREKIESGDMFCFIENVNGMKRWTDGRIWSPSKICDEFLVYQEVPRHLSKNSIKKRKETDGPESRGLMRREDVVDRTTMHKKTICIKHESNSYHIIAYYRPIFVNSSLMDIPFFQKLSSALTMFPILKSDEFVGKNLKRDENFFEEFQIQKEFEHVALDQGKRLMLEEIASEVLVTLWKGDLRRGKQLKGN